MDASRSYDDLTDPTQPIATSFRMMPSPPATRSEESRGNYMKWVTVPTVIAVLLSTGLVAVGVYEFVRGNFGSWQDRARLSSLRGSGNSVAGDLPAIKSNLYGTLAGLKIVGVQPNSSAARVGLKYGDILVAYNQRPVSNEDEISAVMDYAESQRNQGKKSDTAELALYRDGDMTIKTLRVPVGHLGIYTREWTFAYAFVDDAIMQRNDYAEAERYANQAEASRQYTADQVLHMRVLCVNDENNGDTIRSQQVNDLYRRYSADKVTLFGNYDLLYNKRFRAAATIFERYLEMKKVDVSTELNLASCYTELDRYDDAEKLLNKVLARPAGDENAPSAYGLSVLSNIRGKIQMGHHEYNRAQERFLAALEHYPGDSYYVLAFLYCAAQRDVKGEKRGEFEAAYKTVSPQLSETENTMGYHLDALRAFILVKQNHQQEAKALVWKWKDSADAKRYIPVFWKRFPEGGDIIDNWNSLLSGGF